MPTKNATKQVNKASEKRTESLHELDLAYRESAHQCSLISKDEEARRLKVRTMLVQGEASSLKDQLSQRDARIKDLVDQADDVRSQLDSIQEKCRRQDKVMQTQNREIANLKEELASMCTVSKDSSKLLSEKLALSREVDVLRPEVEHLRSQLAHQKDVLAEKLALERQLNALEVELANEKRAVEKAARQKESKNQEEEDALSKQLQDLEKEVAKERKVAQKKIEEQETKSQKAQEEAQSLRERLAETEKDLAAEKRRAEQAAKSKNTVTTQMEEEMDQLKQTVEELEKAIAAEKRGAERKAKNKSSGSEEELNQLREELAETKKALVEEKKEKEQLQKAHEQALVDAEERHNAMGDRVEKLRSKLRDTVEELKKVRSELEKASQDGSVRAPSVSAATTTTVPLKKPGVKANAKKKRTIEDVAMEDNILMTPGASDDRPKRPLKKRGFDTTVLTEKSNFSITPFLNKTIAAIGDSSHETSTPSAPPPPPPPAQEEEEDALPAEAEAAADEADVVVAKPAVANKLVEKKARGRPRGATSALTETKNTKVRKSPLLENVAEEEGDNEDEEGTSSNQENQPALTKAKTKTKKPIIAAPETAPAKTKSGVHAILPDLDEKAEKEPKKKKRKLGAASNPGTIFEEEDEGEKVKPSVPVAAPGLSEGTAAKPHKRPPVARSATAGGPKKGILGGVKSSFAAGGKTFSPLKREKRGVGASFLV
ncbi:hypothetical protein QBC43DRAFT_373925 [Cladorrhinum sp. PSN259]|nr:hypothetical protein QBC43DRAFT_373925 [Cladorrhinum sp. PSN259]